MSAILPANESHPVVAACAEQRAQPPEPFTISQAIADARRIRRAPETGLTDAESKRLIDTLLSALELSTCYLNAVSRGQRTFVLVEQDLAAPFAIRTWIEVADLHGCPAEKTQGAMKIALAFDQSKVERKWPD